MYFRHTCRCDLDEYFHTSQLANVLLMCKESEYVWFASARLSPSAERYNIAIFLLYLTNFKYIK